MLEGVPITMDILIGSICALDREHGRDICVDEGHMVTIERVERGLHGQ